MRAYLPVILALLSVCSLHCGSSDSSQSEGYQDASPSDSNQETAAWSRDWNTYPAIVDLPSSPTIYAISDIHGGYGRLLTLLTNNAIISDSPDAPSDAHWSAGSAILVVVGDLINKGPKSVEVIELFRALSQSANAAGGRVIVLLGNHEAEFLADPLNSKASDSDGIGQQLAKQGINPVTFASAANPNGLWLRQLPFGLRVGKWFFCHAGNTGGKSVSDLDATLTSAVDSAKAWSSKEIIGDDSILESTEWFTNTTLPPAYAANLKVSHIVFGHDPSALGDKGKIATDSSQILFRIDVGMSPDIDDSNGIILRITNGNTAEELLPDGTIRQSWSSL